MPSSLLGPSWQTKAQQDQAGRAVHSWGWGEHNQAEGVDGSVGRVAGTSEKPSDQKTCWVFMQALPAHLQPWTLMWLHLPKTSLIWQGMQATPSLSQQGFLSYALQQVAWIEEKELFTFKEVVSFPPFQLAAPTHTPSWASFFEPRCQLCTEGKKSHSPCSQPRAKQPNLPKVFCVCFSLLSSFRQNVAPLLLTLRGTSCRNRWQ